MWFLTIDPFIGISVFIALSYSKRWTLYVTQCGFWELHSSNGPKSLVLCRKIDEDSGGSMSWNTQPNCLASFTVDTALLAPSFFGFFAGLIFNLPVLKSTLIPECASRFLFVQVTFGRMPKITWWSRALTFGAISARLWDSFFSEYFYHPFLSVVQRKERILVSIWPAYSHCARNYNHLLSNTVLLLSMNSIPLVLFQHHVDPCDSWPLLLFQFSHFGRQSFVMWVSDLCFSSPSCSTSDNLVSISSDGGTIWSTEARMQSREGRLCYSWTSTTNSIQSYEIDHTNLGYETSRREHARLHEELAQWERALWVTHISSIHEVYQRRDLQGDCEPRILSFQQKEHIHRITWLIKRNFRSRSFILTNFLQGFHVGRKDSTPK